jgi:hypothetical protein
LDDRELQTHIREATHTIDRLFSRLALISISPARTPEQILLIREELAVESHRYWRFLQEDILDCLTGTGNDAAVAVANAWKPFYFGIK